MRWWNVGLPIVLGVLAAALILLRTATHGPGATPDSVHYLYQIRAIGRGTLLNGDPTPPMFAALCWLVHKIFDLSPMSAAGAINATAFGLTVFIMTFWCRRSGASNMIVMWCGIICILSPLASIAAEFMTEALFVFLVTLTLFSLDRFLGGRKWLLLIVAMFAAAGACMTRLIGVAVIAAGIILVFSHARKSLVERFFICFLFGAGSFMPLVVWALFSNVNLVSPTSNNGFRELLFLQSISNTFVEWTFGRAVARGPSVLNRWTEFSSPWMTATVKLGVLVAFYFPWLITFCLFLVNKCKLARSGAPANAIFLLSYALLLLPILWHSDIHPPMRYFVPMYLPVLFILALVLQSHCHYAWHLVKFRFRPINLRSVAVIGVLSVMITWQCVRLPSLVLSNLDSVKDHMDNGQRLTSRAWFGSATMTYARQNIPAHAVVWSNQRAVVFLNSSNRFDVKHVKSARPEFLGEQGEHHYVVWFHEIPGRLGWPWGQYTSFAHQQILQSYIDSEILQIMAAFDDGIVFRVGWPATPAWEIRAKAGDALVERNKPFYIGEGVEAYLVDKRVIYRLRGAARCPFGDLRFFLHVTPVRHADLSEWRINAGETDENLDTLFEQGSRYVKAACAVVIPLPDFDVRSFKTGNWIRDENGRWMATEWEVEVQVSE